MDDPFLIGIRFALFAVLMLIAGLAAFLLHALGADERRNSALAARIWRAEQWLCVIGLVLSTLAFALLAASMAGVSIGEVEPEFVGELIVKTDMGAAWLARSGALLAAIAAAFRSHRHPNGAAVVVAAAGAAALASLVWTGHAGAAEGLGGIVHRASDAVHMIAAAVWIGAIAGFLLWLAPGPVTPACLDIAVRGLEGFARTGTICVFLIAATGLINTEFTLGIAYILDAPTSAYVRLLLIKIFLFMMMLAIAAANRWRLVPALRQCLCAPSSRNFEGHEARLLIVLRRQLLIEAAAALTILGLVAWLGTLPPETALSGS